MPQMARSSHKGWKLVPGGGRVSKCIPHSRVVGRQEKGAKMISWVLLAACAVIPETVLSQDTSGGACSCRTLVNGSVCEFDFEPETEAQDPCCAMDCFPERLQFSNFQRDSLSLSVDYRTRDEAALTIQWQYADLSTCPIDTVDPDLRPSSPVQFMLTQSGTKRCLCLPPSVTSVRTSLLDPPIGCYEIDDRSVVNVSVEVKVNDPYDGAQLEPCITPTNSFVSYMTHKESVQDCWTVTGETSLSICGKQVPSEPVAVTALAGDMQATNNIAVEWSPPIYHNTPIVGYIIEVFTQQKGKPLLKSTVTGNVTQFVVELAITLKEEDNPFIKPWCILNLHIPPPNRRLHELSSSSCTSIIGGQDDSTQGLCQLLQKCKGTKCLALQCLMDSCGFAGMFTTIDISNIYHEPLQHFIHGPSAVYIAAGVYSEDDVGFCREGSVDGDFAIFSKSISAPVEWPPCCTATESADGGFSESELHAILWPSVGAALLLAVAVMIFVFLVVRRKRRHTPRELLENGLHEKTPHLTRSVSTASSIHEKDTVFLAASTEEDADVKRRIRHLCHVLGENGFTPVYYEYVANDHSADSPSALGINRWVELQFSRCEFVLFVCTKRFLEEWNGERKDILSPLVYPCRNLLDGSLTRPHNISRFAVLFMGEERRVPTGLKNFKQFELFTADGDNIHADRLVCYLHETPPYVMPQVAHCVPLKQFL